jgi:hypothetical protein
VRAPFTTFDALLWRRPRLVVAAGQGPAFLRMHDLLFGTIRRSITLVPAEEALLRQWFVPEAVPKGGFFLQGS